MRFGLGIPESLAGATLPRRLLWLNLTRLVVLTILLVTYRVDICRSLYRLGNAIQSTSIGDCCAFIRFGGNFYGDAQERPVR